MARRKKASKAGVGRRKMSKRRTPQETIADLEKEIARLRERVDLDQQFSPKTIRSERSRLELSAADYGELIGVSGLTIYKWEKGESHPRRRQLEAWLEVQGIDKDKAWKQLGYA